MADLKTYRVLRRHEGDRMYEEGDTRELSEAEAAHLIPNVLEPVAEKAAAKKAEAAAPLNKAEPAAPENKAAVVASTSRNRKAKG